jgi:hypothetical protein
MNPTRRKILRHTLIASASCVVFPYIGNKSWAQNGSTNYIPGERGLSSNVSELELSNNWEGLNPGYWKIDSGHLRRATTAIGDRARSTGFPFHYESATNPDGVMQMDYDPSLPMSILWNRKWKLANTYSLHLEIEIKELAKLQRKDDDSSWRMYQPDYGLIGIAVGGKTQFESFYPSANASPLFVIKQSGEFGIMRNTSEDLVPANIEAMSKVKALQEKDIVRLWLDVSGNTLVARLQINDEKVHQCNWQTDPEMLTGYLGIAARGLLDISVSKFEINPIKNKPLLAPVNDCHVCYALGDSLEEAEEGWKVRFVSLFRTSGDIAEIRVASIDMPSDGWQSVSVAGSAPIISNDFRECTSIIDVILPFNPADKTQYFTIWKDGVDVTPDPRISTDSVGPGTGLVGDVPISGKYVGRLPRLTAPYRICGLSCHAISTAAKAELPDSSGGRCGRKIVGGGAADCGISNSFYVHDQPCYNAFKHLEDYDFQVMLWEDDVWYMELLIYPPSTKDAYKTVTTSIAGPTTRWQMMRHWNVLNPGDHDHGMDDVKGPEQLLIRNRADLGQDPTYMVRNFQIVSHLMTGKENPTGTDNPKRWRKWKMPNRDFSLLVMDSRLWRTSQDPAIWDDEGWGHDKEIYSRTDPTRVLLGEEQYSWLQDQLTTDSSTLICLTGINALHTIWGGHDGQGWLNSVIDRDRVSADYAGWVKVAADRVLDLISNRDGVVSVYGDVHAGSIVRNKDNRVVECSFGPIGRWGGRSLVNGFGPEMNDFDGRPLDCIALYHNEFSNPKLEKQESINYWNFLDMAFDSSLDDAEIRIAIRNIIDTADTEIRGGGQVNTKATDIGKQPTVRINPRPTLANADLLFLSEAGTPIRGARSRANGEVTQKTLIGVEPGERVVILATSLDKSDSQIIIATEV